MQRLSAASIAVAAALLLTPLAAADDGPEPVEFDCGEGRTFWHPLQTCVTVPVLKKKVDPDFHEAPADLQYGALIYLRVSAKGAVADVQVVKAPLEGEVTADGEAALSAFVQAVRQWQFEPGYDPRGAPVAMTVVLKVNLRAED